MAAGLALAKSVPWSSPYPVELERQCRRGAEQQDLERDVIEPVPRKRRVGAFHRAISQVVPALESLIATPIAASRSRMRSDSLKSLRLRAAVRSESRRSTS